MCQMMSHPRIAILKGAEEGISIHVTHTITGKVKTENRGMGQLSQAGSLLILDGQQKQASDA